MRELELYYMNQKVLLAQVHTLFKPRLHAHLTYPPNLVLSQA